MNAFKNTRYIIEIVSMPHTFTASRMRNTIDQYIRTNQLVSSTFSASLLLQFSVDWVTRRHTTTRAPANLRPQHPMGYVRMVSHWRVRGPQSADRVRLRAIRLHRRFNASHQVCDRAI
jgi:hypothetical protein